MGEKSGQTVTRLQTLLSKPDIKRQFMKSAFQLFHNQGCLSGKLIFLTKHTLSICFNFYILHFHCLHGKGPLDCLQWKTAAVKLAQQLMHQTHNTAARFDPWYWHVRLYDGQQVKQEGFLQALPIPKTQATIHLRL